MSFGVILPNHVSIAGPEAYRTIATRAEELGFDHVWLGDHIVMPSRTASDYPDTETGESPFDPDQPAPDPLATMAYLAGCTTRIKLGTFVLIVPQREPLSTAKIISTVDCMSGGRFLLGVGVGWQEEEFLAVGVDTFRERGAVTDEYLRIYKELWTESDPEFDGRYSRFSRIKFHPKPAQKPHPPIWVGGYTRAAMRRAATLGDVWSPVGQQPQAALEPDEMAEAIQELKDMVERAGRRRDAVEASYTASILFDPRSAGPRRTLTGTAGEIASDVLRFQDAGVQHFVLAFGSDREGLPPIDGFFGSDVEEILASIEQFAAEVIARVAP